jgi:ferredoxin
LLRGAAATALVGWAALPDLQPVEAKPHNRVPTLLANRKTWPVAPPGAGDLARFNDLCTACHLCVNACPYGVLQPALLEYGLSGLLQPHMDYASGYCSYECNRCGQICPTGAIRPLDLAAKQTVQFGIAHFVRDNCIVYTDHTACGACDEYCPTKAVHMIPYRDGLTIPEVRETLCVGCGACENACPARPHRAIYVDGHPAQQQALRPTAKPLEREIHDEFPF